MPDRSLSNVPPVTSTAAVPDGALPPAALPAAPTALPNGALPPAAATPPASLRVLAEYPDLRYRDVFWPGRDYEDLCDRLALRSLLRPAGERLLDVGAGFGRLVDEYGGYRAVVLLDASEAHLAAARERFAGVRRVAVVAGDAAHLPFPDASFDAVVCVRMVHHLADPPPVIAELGRVLRPGGELVLEFANKRNLKAVLRFLARRQAWSPFAPGSAAYRTAHFDHAPRDVRRWLRSAGLQVEATRTASLLRVPVLSRHLPLPVLAAVESPLQRWLAAVTPGPSVFVRARRRPG